MPPARLIGVVQPPGGIVRNRREGFHAPPRPPCDPRGRPREGVVVGVERVKYLFWLWLRGLLNAGCVVGAAAHVEVGEL
jgi:hypothetical protein